MYIGQGPQVPYDRHVSDATDPIEALHAEVWHGLLRVQRDVARACDAALLRTHRLGLSAFDVLYTVGQAPGGTLDMRTLVHDALLSQSQVSRTVTGLVHLGLLERHAVSARAVRVSITATGREHLAAARRTQADTLDDVLFGSLTVDDVQHLAQLLHRIPTAHLRSRGPRPNQRPTPSATQ